MKILHRDGQIAKKANKEWFAQNCVFIEDDEFLKKSFGVSIFAHDGNDDKEVFVKTFKFPEYPTEGEIMYCLRKTEVEYKYRYYSFTASVDEIYSIKDDF